MSRLHKWIENLEPEALLKIWKVVKILKTKADATGSNVFITPFNMFDENQLDRNETEEILMSLHHKGIIEAIKTKSTPQSTNPNRPKFSVDAISDNIRLYRYLFTDLYNNLNNRQELITKSNKDILSYELKFFSDNGIATYRGEKAMFIGKAKALLTYLNNNRGTPFSLSDIQKGCNANLQDMKKFKKEKDVYDTYRNIKEKLKVKKGEFFPIEKTPEHIIWIAK